MVRGQNRFKEDSRWANLPQVWDEEEKRREEAGYWRRGKSLPITSTQRNIGTQEEERRNSSTRSLSFDQSNESSFLKRIFSNRSCSTSRRSSLSPTLQRSNNFFPSASVAILDQEQLLTQRSSNNNNLSLVSKLDSIQLTDSTFKSPVMTKPKQFEDFETVNEALPVVKAAVRFVTALEKEKLNGNQNFKTSRNWFEDIQKNQKGKAKRKSHELY